MPASAGWKRKAETRDLRQYRKLVYNVKKVYPYAKLAGSRYGEVVAHLESLEKGKDQREYIRKVEDEILKDYEEELKNLTITQGRILIPAALREYAQLESTAHITGMDTNLEIWNTELWKEENEKYTPESIASIVEELDF